MELLNIKDSGLRVGIWSEENNRYKVIFDVSTISLSRTKEIFLKSIYREVN